jgi:hypothetical protein
MPKSPRKETKGKPKQEKPKPLDIKVAKPASTPKK